MIELCLQLSGWKLKAVKVIASKISQDNLCLLMGMRRIRSYQKSKLGFATIAIGQCTPTSFISHIPNDCQFVYIDL